MFAKLEKSRNLSSQAAVWSKGALGLFLAFLLLLFSFPQLSAASAGEFQWLGSDQVGSYHDRVFARPIADVEVRDDFQEIMDRDRFAGYDRSILNYAERSFSKLARIWIETTLQETSFSILPLGRGPPSSL